MSGDDTDFGFQRVPADDKARRVGEVFRSVAGRYDLMNDLMSGGLHRLWKRQAVAMAGLRPGYQVLDLASGTGDLARLMAPRVGDAGRVIMSDINESMLCRGRDRMLDCGLATDMDFVLADAEHLPFADASMDRITMAFGLRNVTRKEAALEEMRRVLKPGGMVLILEFSRLRLAPLEPFYEAYSFRILPRLGKLIADDAESYRYLAESIRMHPDQETLRDMMQAAGLEDCDYTNMSGGIVAVHRGRVY
ncbi:bifunctional demethylmenaquinone methyltransferase/2-methoxy-6-polyprenyl-1,4-benzoquinol methylase UbiE [Methylonatrum kenyense]|uniref:bifunctional demethylmenaquinone methyltransferase/2-methoxy-6-polyprenyl-1,4-benzoquinol methylase UbiE n=1 Tax=Methylonatrum kenyense TaxID=455253 RepID=UPI0020BF89CD|nr:bifunctional demethylmenaquinone methyltransferase/2-methoxy-6-polyprenyl-1,4-benzoquinol methylase UbiE [Methylonatrum kenyense]MCK8515284.1 bifunctional demethylmenaquinone methyltransferase/2-methoxy-6-polyprenyl-1,4-benzoquinol methylase UbiE [Methylonatrum kenyense]